MRPDVWAQLKNITASDLISALERDDWLERASGGSAVVFKKEGKKVVVNNHPHKTYGPKQLRELLNDVGWEEKDLKRLKLIK